MAGRRGRQRPRRGRRRSSVAAILLATAARAWRRRPAAPAGLGGWTVGSPPGWVGLRSAAPASSVSGTCCCSRSARRSRPICRPESTRSSLNARSMASMSREAGRRLIAGRRSALELLRVAGRARRHVRARNRQNAIGGGVLAARVRLVAGAPVGCAAGSGRRSRSSAVRRARKVSKAASSSWRATSTRPCRATWSSAWPRR